MSSLPVQNPHEIVGLLILVYTAVEYDPVDDMNMVLVDEKLLEHVTEMLPFRSLRPLAVMEIPSGMAMLPWKTG